MSVSASSFMHTHPNKYKQNEMNPMREYKDNKQNASREKKTRQSERSEMYGLKIRSHQYS